MTNKTMMQYFEWYLTANGLHWNRCVSQAKSLKEAGINMVWLPPAYKGADGAKSVGYDVYDTYDLGEFSQKGSVATKYGTKEEYEHAIKAFQENGIEVLADVVLNHMMGADEAESVLVKENAANNREVNVSGLKWITAWTKFTFPGRAGKYSSVSWSAKNFSGTDWDASKKKTGIYCFYGKKWNRETDDENGNFDYLMGADLDTDDPDTVKAITDWGNWYLDTMKMDGFRLDAVKHIGFEFYRNWLKATRSHVGRDYFAVGEYWSAELPKLLHYLDVTENSLSLFDVPLHYHFLQAATSNGNYDMKGILDGTLLKERPQNAVTFVDNHDTQPGQALYSFIPAWFKPIAYALILFHKDSMPCVFYGDYYGIPHDRVQPVAELKKLLKIRELYAYGEQTDYFDHDSVVGLVRSGDSEHPDSGLVLLVTDSNAGSKRMQVGASFAGAKFYDALGHFSEPVILDETGTGEFKVDGGSVSVWLTEKAYQKMCIEVE